MAALTWDKEGERLYETGVDRGVFYPYNSTTKKFSPGVAWNGLSNVSENPSGGEASAVYADNIKYLNLMSIEEFSATVEAYMYPEEFAECDGTAELADGVYAGQQTRKKFGFCYRTKIGNDTELDEHGYKLHLVYNCMAKPTSKSYSSTNDSPEAGTFSWELSTTPVNVPNNKPTAIITIDSTKAEATKLAALEAKLYGKDSAEPELPLPSEVITLMSTAG